MTNKAELEHIGNKLHWIFHKNLVTDKGCEFFNVHWVIKDVVDWLKTFASVSQTRTATVTGDKGTVKTFQIDLITGEVEEIEADRFRQSKENGGK